MLTFKHLNVGWNAEPNAPDLSVEQDGHSLVARFKPNPFLYPEFKEVSWILVRFENCAKYRITNINDEGWHLGQCRFSRLAPEWGEFYEVVGDTNDDADETPWITIGGTGSRHFHLYLRDEALEVKAQGWWMRTES